MNLAGVGNLAIAASWTDVGSLKGPADSLPVPLKVKDIREEGKNANLEIRELFMMPGGGEKGEGELVHGHG